MKIYAITCSASFDFSLFAFDVEFREQIPSLSDRSESSFRIFWSFFFVLSSQLFLFSFVWISVAQEFACKGFVQTLSHRKKWILWFWNHFVIEKSWKNYFLWYFYQHPSFSNDDVIFELSLRNTQSFISGTVCGIVYFLTCN